jgi:hypothetical protein
MLKKYKNQFAEIMRHQTKLSFEEIIGLIEVPPENI